MDSIIYGILREKSICGFIVNIDNFGQYGSVTIVINKIFQKIIDIRRIRR
jgi:hypothetical protein